MHNSIFDIFGSHQSSVLSSVPKFNGQSTGVNSSLHNLKGAGPTLLKQKGTNVGGRTPLKTVLGDVGNKIGKNHLSTKSDAKNAKPFTQNMPAPKKMLETPTSKRIEIRNTPVHTTVKDSECDNFSEVNDIFVDTTEDEPYFDDYLSKSLRLTTEEICNIVYALDNYPKELSKSSPPVSPESLIEECNNDDYMQHFDKFLDTPDPYLLYNFSDIPIPDLTDDSECEEESGVGLHSVTV